MIDDTWSSRELPLLIVLARYFDDPDAHPVRLAEVVQLSGIEADSAKRGLAKLCVARPPFIDGETVEEERCPVIITGVTERALLASGQWPSADALADRLVEAVRTAAESDPDGERGSRLRTAAQVLGSIGKEVISQWIAGNLPHP